MKLKLLSGLALAALLAGSANAAIYTVSKDYGTSLKMGTPSQYIHSYSDSLDLTTVGYTPGTNLAWGTVSFIVRDQTNHEPEPEIFKIDIDNLLQIVHGGPLPFFNVTLSSALGLDLLASLENTGVLHFTVNAIRGTFYLKGSSLTVETPDGATTLSLLGLGLLGIAAIRRKMA